MESSNSEGGWRTNIKIKNKNYLDEYFFVKEIGKGAYASIAKTKTKIGGLSRAAKIIKSIHITSDPAKAQKLYAEISVPLTLDHPNLVKLYEVF